MNRMFRNQRLAAGLTAAALTIAAAGCGIEKQTAPELAGPSEFGTSISLSATPDTLNRDGESQATIGLAARNESGGPIAGLAVSFSIDPISGGTLSATQVVTDSAGRAAVVFTAPSIDTLVTSVRISARPLSTDFGSAAARGVSVALLAPDAAIPSFTWTPEAPQQYQPVTLNGSGTLFRGVACALACTYRWIIGTEATLTGQVVTYNFQQQTTYAVILEVTSPTGVTTRIDRNIAVSAPTAPTAAFTISPTNPRIGDTVFFNGTSSTAANGATIVEYTWDFGNGQATATGPSVSTTYSVLRTYVVRLTVRDSNGQTATVTQNLSIGAP